MPRCHILSEFIWPDGAPTGIYADQLADALHQTGISVVRVGGKGSYRKTSRPRLEAELIYLDHFCGQRGNLISTARGYGSIFRIFENYISAQVESGDLVLVTSAPPLTLHLATSIRQKQAIPVYWLQDYYPELVAGLHCPHPLRRILHHWWHHHLKKWSVVVKISSNLDYSGENSVVIRNWPTLSIGAEKPFIPKRALYLGNLGYGHCLPSFLKRCRELHEDGYSIMVRGDGPGMRRLPSSIEVGPHPADENELVELLWSAEAHLVAAHPRIQGALFPSKFWNARATGRTILTSGFSGAMKAELDLAAVSDLESPLNEWCQLIHNRMNS